MKIGHANYSLHDSYNVSISQEDFTRDLGTCVFLANVTRPPQLLKGFARAVRYTHVCGL